MEIDNGILQQRKDVKEQVETVRLFRYNPLVYYLLKIAFFDITASVIPLAAINNVIDSHRALLPILVKSK